MRGYEELMKRLRICPDYNEGCKKCPHEHDLGCRSTTMREAADAIEELSVVIEIYRNRMVYVPEPPGGWYNPDCSQSTSN